MSRCMFCGLCEEACPEEAIVMSRQVEVSSYSRRGSLWHKTDLLVPEGRLKTRIDFLRGHYDFPPAGPQVPADDRAGK